MINISKRGLLSGLICAPMVIPYERLMKVKEVLPPEEFLEPAWVMTRIPHSKYSDLWYLTDKNTFSVDLVRWSGQGIPYLRWSNGGWITPPKDRPFAEWRKEQISQYRQKRWP